MSIFDHMTNEIYCFHSILQGASRYHHAGQAVGDTPGDQTKLPIVATRNASPALMLIPP
jgi:hypothetical protein